jgi:DNA repair protein SbcC/Rad50
VHLRSLSLRNYRVYRAVDLEFPDGLVGIYGPNGSGKCLPGHVRVYDGDAGGMVPISQFVAERRKRTLGLVGSRVMPVSVLDWIALGDKPTVEVTLHNGARLEVAETHPLLTDRGCVQAKDLTPAHWVAEAATIPASGPPRLTTDEAMLLGMLLGDGSLASSGIVLTAGEEAVGDLFRELVERLLPGATTGAVRKQGTSARQLYVRSRLDPAARRLLMQNVLRRLHDYGIPLERHVRQANLIGVLRGDRGLAWDTLCAIEEDYGIDLFPERCRLYPARALLSWVRDLGLVGATAGSKRIPPDLMTLPDEQAWALLGGLWLTDGWFSLRGSRPEVALVSKSRQLADGVRLLLRRVSVRSSLQRVTSDGRPCWRVLVAVDGLPKLRHMPLVGVKAERRDHILAQPTSRRPGTNGDMIPPSFNARITSWTSPSGRNRGPKQRHHSMNRSIFRDFAGPGSVADDETVWARVVSVTPTGEAVPCFDLEVDSKEHLYLAESFVVHNSTLIESIRFALYGDSRTDKSELRSAGVREDLRVELVFEHEGNTYEVRRHLKGLNLTPKVEVYRNGQLAVQSAREANAFLGRVIGMDQRAFLASVCAQQKELTAFTSMIPSERRRLVLDLLGVSPVERALAQVREEGRDARTRAAGARAQLPDLEAAEQTAAAAAAERVDAEAAEQAAAADERAAAADLEAAEAALAAAEQAAAALVELRNQAGMARAAAAAARAEAERHDARAAAAAALDPEIEAAEAETDELEAAAAPLDELEQAREAHGERQALARALEDAHKRERTATDALAHANRDAAATAELVTTREAAEHALDDLDRELEAARDRHGTLARELGATTARMEAASDAAEAVVGLDPDAPCPTCGQPLGARHAEIRRHRDQELDTARTANAKAAAALDQAKVDGMALAARRSDLAGELKQAREAERHAERAAAQVEAAEAALAAIHEELAERRAALDAAPDPGFDPAAHQRAKAAAARRDELATLLAGLRARRDQAEQDRLAAKDAHARADEAEQRAAALDAEAAGRRDAEDALVTARDRQRAAAQAATIAHGARQQAAAALTAARRRDADLAAALTAARERHDRVAALEEEAGYLARLADLVAAFRLHLVSRLGRRLSAEAATLFGELTENEYQDLVVDPEDYAIRIADGGTEYELSRFSGSENDLASLSLRVAVSLVIAEGAGELGLLVLDEVLGALDRERRGHMLAALTALSGRFRQVLLVTHNDEVKDLLPAAIEVRKGEHRTATAAVLAS